MKRIMVGPGTRHIGSNIFVLYKSAGYYDTEQTQNCSYLCYRSIATKREMIRFTVVRPGTFL